MNEDKVISIFILSKLNVKSRSVRVYTLKRSMKRGLKIELLEKVVEMLAMGEPLPEKNNDHALAGDWIGHRECHILPDWLLIYIIENDILTLTLRYFFILILSPSVFTVIAPLSMVRYTLLPTASNRSRTSS